MPDPCHSCVRPDCPICPICYPPSVPRRILSLSNPYGVHGGRGGGGGAGGRSGAVGTGSEDLEGSTAYSSRSEGPNLSDNLTPSESTKSYDDSKPQDNLPRMPIVDLSVGSLAKTQALNRMEMRREKHPKWQLGKSDYMLRLQRAWVVHSAWASIENVLKISSNILVNKLQCEHIVDHFKVIADVLKKLGLHKDFVSGEDLEGCSGVQTNLTFNEMQFNRVAKTFNEKHSGERDLAIFFIKTRIQYVSRMFQDYIRQLPALDGSSEESLSKQSEIDKDFLGFSLLEVRTKENVEAQPCHHKPCNLDDLSSTIQEVLELPNSELPTSKSELLYHSNEESLSKQSNINEDFQDFSLQGLSIIENVEARTHDRKQRSLDEFLCLLLGGLKRGGDLLLFHSKLEGTNDEVVRQTGVYGEEFVQIHELLYNLLDFYACLKHCEGTQFARGYLSQHDSCRAQTLLYYLNSNCLDLQTSLRIDDDFLNIELAVRISELLERPNCALKDLYIRSSPRMNVDREEMRKSRLLVIVALKKCMSITKLFINGFNGEELHELCNSLLDNKVLQYMLISTDGPLADNNAMDLSAILKEKHNLEGFTLEFKGISSKGVFYLGAMLAENSSLKKMNVIYRVLDKIDTKHLMRPSEASKAINVPKPRVYIHLDEHLGSLQMVLELSAGIAEMITQILSANKTLIHFSMFSGDSNSNVACEILDSLKKNKTLQVLDLQQFNLLQDARVNIALMDLLVNYNFSLSMIRMDGREWDIETFIKFKLEHHVRMEDSWSIDDGTLESPIAHSAHDSKQVVEDFQLEKGEGSSAEVHGSSVMAFEKHQKVLVKGLSSKPNVICGLKSKLEMESEQSLEELKPLLESIMKSANFSFLQRNLNMAQLLQERYSQWNSFIETYPSILTDEEKDEFSKGCITAALFPKTFLYHLKVHLLQEQNPRGILHGLKEVANLVVQKMKSLQDFGSQTFQFIDYVDFQAPLDIQHIYSPRKIIAICQIFSTRTRIGEDLQVENAIQYGIVQDHLTRAYYFESDKSSNLDKPNLDKPTGVIGIKVTSIEIHVEIMWEDGSCYSGALEDFSYDLELDDNKQCALEAFGDLKGAHFLQTRGLKCSPLLVIALAMAIDKKGLALTWSNGKGHIQSNPILPSLQPMKLEVWECQILYGGDINQLGDAVEWGMNQLGQNCTSCKDNHPHNSKDLSVAVAQFAAATQNKQKWSVGCKVFGTGGDIGFEKQNSKGKKVEDQAFKKIQEVYWEEKKGYVVVGKLNDKHRMLEERLCQGSLYAEPDLNYLVVYDDHKASHVSIYWVNERNDEPRLELEWITDICIKEGPERIKKIFNGLKGEMLEVTRRCTEFHENSLQQQSKGLMKWFTNQLSNKGSCKDNALQMVSIVEGPSHPIISNDEWVHIVGLQPYERTKFWLKASYMQAITYSRTRYSSGLLLSTHTTNEYGLKWGSASRKSRLDESHYVHYIDEVKSCAKFSKPPESLSSKWHDMFHWGGLKETLV